MQSTANFASDITKDWVLMKNDKSGEIGRQQAASGSWASWASYLNPMPLVTHFFSPSEPQVSEPVLKPVPKQRAQALAQPKENGQEPKVEHIEKAINQDLKYSLFAANNNNRAHESIDFSESLISPRYDRATNKIDFARFLELHQILWQGSSTYRKIWCEVGRKTGKRLAISSAQGLAFDAEANFQLHAIRINNPHLLTDARVASLMAFELTNFWQRAQFLKQSERAFAGSFFLESGPGEDSLMYAYANEFIEHKGLLFHNVIIEQMKMNFPLEQYDAWYINQKVRDIKLIGMTFSEYVSSEYSGHHIAYYQDFYEKNIRPHLIKKQQDTLKDRMRALDNAGQISRGPEGQFFKKDGKWVKVQ